jgi:hypothetical protein
MKCRSCGANIPPEWVNAINSNVCPGCGGAIMDEKSKELLDELANAMERMPNDPQGVAGWLLSNYEFRKVGDGIPTEKFHRKGAGPEVDTSDLKVDPAHAKFHKAAGSKAFEINPTIENVKKSKNGKLAELASNIQSIADPYGDDDIEVDNEYPDDEDLKAFAELRKSGFDPFGESGAGPQAQASITDVSQVITQDDIKSLTAQVEDEYLPHERILLKSEEGKAVVNKSRYKKLQSQEIFASGGGAFRR